MISAVLAALLLLVVPGKALLGSRNISKARPRLNRYRNTIGMVLLLLGILGAAMGSGSPTPTALGLSPVLDTTAKIALAFAIVLIGALFATTLLAKPKQPTEANAEATAMLPQSAAELRIYLIMAVIIGFGWEVLYRGFLLWWLPQFTGMGAAVLLSSLAYGLAHGWNGLRKSLGSLVSALLFALGYVATGSLWWLIAIHIAMPMVAVIAMRRMQNAALAPRS